MVTEPKFEFKSVKLDNREHRFHDNIRFPMQTQPRTQDSL